MRDPIGVTIELAVGHPITRLAITTAAASGRVAAQLAGYITNTSFDRRPGWTNRRTSSLLVPELGTGMTGARAQGLGVLSESLTILRS